MRMRKKKNCGVRMERCSDLWIREPEQYKGKWHEVFGNDNPIHLEIGCGKGKFITELAAKNPDINYIAFEKNLDVLVLASEKIKNAGLNNVRFVAGDACILEQMNINNEIDRIYINFCNPWPKDRHAKRRLPSRQFLARFDQILKEGGVIEFKTDNKDLFAFAEEEVEPAGWKILEITYDLHNDEKMVEGNIMTEYEEKFSSMGNPIYKYIITR